MIEAYKKMWKYGFTFTGRTSRADFWYAYLANFLVGVIFGFITGFVTTLVGEGAGAAVSLLTSVYSIAVLIPGLALEIRRLHDVNKSGWYLLMSLIPLVGWIFVLIAYCSASVEPNNYGTQL